MQDIAAPRDTPPRNLHDVGGKRAKERGGDVLQSPVLSYNRRSLAPARLLSHERPILLGLSLGKVYPFRLLAFSSSLFPSLLPALPEPFFLICCQREVPGSLQRVASGTHYRPRRGSPGFSIARPDISAALRKQQRRRICKMHVFMRARMRLREIDCSTGLIVRAAFAQLFLSLSFFSQLILTPVMGRCALTPPSLSLFFRYFNFTSRLSLRSACSPRLAGA